MRLADRGFGKAACGGLGHQPPDCGIEARLGTPLFERHPRGMVLNAAGEILADHARRAGLDAERALDEIKALQGLRSGKVRIAVPDAFASEFCRACARPSSASTAASSSK